MPPRALGRRGPRRRSAALSERGLAFEAAISERLRAQLARAYRTGGLDGVAGARAILSAMAGGRTKRPGPVGGR